MDSMSADWHEVSITDKTQKVFFKTTASPMATMSEVRNLKRHLEQAKANPKAYHFLDVPSAVILLDGTPYAEPVAPTEQELDALLAELQTE